MKLTLNPNYDLYRKDDKAFCDSLQVAETFDRQHKTIIRTIQTLAEHTSGLSEEFIKANYIKTSYKDSSGKRSPKYLMTKRGFTMVVMEFKTAKARRFKEALLNRFDEMEKFIATLVDVKEDFPEFTEAVKLAHAEPKPYHYINEINMLYSLVLGQTVQSFKKKHGITTGNVRDYLTTEQLLQFRKLQRADIGLLMVIPELMQRKKILSNRAQLIGILEGSGTNAN